MSWLDDLTPNGFNVGIPALKLLSAGTQYIAAKQRSKAEQKWQSYQNAMTNLSNAQNQTAISHNEEMAVQQAGQERVDIQRGGMITEAKVAVQAAAAGVAGKSVTESLLDVQRNAAAREQSSIEELNNTLLGYQQKRASSEFEAKIRQNYSYIPTPSAGDYLLNASMDIAKFGMENQAPTNNPVQQINNSDIIWNGPATQ